MLSLAVPTDEGWFDRVVDHLDTILIDHCHLEKRAASNALNLIFRYTGRDTLPRALSEVVREEMDHFEMMLDVLDERGVEFIRLTPSAYASHLKDAIRRQEPGSFLDRLLMAGLIEARSCERFQVLSERLEDPNLAQLYADLVISEARHHTLYVNLARKFYDHDEVKSRLNELAAVEAEAIQLSTKEPRLHSF